ncbi:hypothetical protein K439DRAFT_1626248 [Ramaria rubella]|nr:hypothetical protein K439DRAFT_1626248 [Ramaria rubella]
MRFLSVGLLVLAATQAVLSAPVFRRGDSNDVDLYVSLCGVVLAIVYDDYHVAPQPC